MDNFDLGELRAGRREMVAQTLRRTSPAEIRDLVGKLFVNRTDHPWSSAVQEFLEGNARAALWRAEIPDHAGVVFCADEPAGFWYRLEGPAAAVGLLGTPALEGLAEMAREKSSAC